jgi:Ca-activated chloride channel family protein
MSLRYPLALLLILPLIAWFAIVLRNAPRGTVSPLERLARAGKSFRSFLWWLPELFTFCFCLVAIVLIAGPQRDIDPGKDDGEGLAMAIAIDRSSSMSAQIPYNGENISRLEGVKLATKDFLEHREKDYFCLISFARYPETHSPLTANRAVLLDFLKLIDVPRTQDEDGTAIGDALTLACARLSGLGPDKKGIVIMLTDGKNNQGEKSPEEAARVAKEAGVTLYAIGLGGQGMIMQGGQIFGMPIDIDEEGLTAMARETGGQFFRVDRMTDLAALYTEIAQRETIKLKKDKPRETELILAPGLIALLALLGLSVVSRYALLRRGDL